MATKTLYMVIVNDTWRILRRGFKTWEGAYEWALSHDWGQYENEGGLGIRPYTA